MKQEQKLEECECEELNILEEHTFSSNAREITLQCDLCKSEWRGIVFKK